MTRLEVWAPDGIGEVREGDDLVGLVADAVPELADGDVVVVTSKIVSKAEGRTSTRPRDEVVAEETVRTVAHRGSVRIVENRLGLVMAAAGVDASNVEPGSVLRLPRDPDATARSLRAGLLERTGRNLAVVISDTSGRAWRVGQTDIAIGVAGLLPVDELGGAVDGYGNPLVVTAPAVADEITGAAELVSGKTTGRPLVVVRGLAERVLRPGEPGPGARALLRAVADDLFALGSRDAVVAALAGTDAAAFGPPAPIADLLAALHSLQITAAADGDDVLAEAPPAAAVAVAHAHGWERVDQRRFRPRVP